MKIIDNTTIDKIKKLGEDYYVVVISELDDEKEYQIKITTGYVKAEDEEHALLNFGKEKGFIKDGDIKRFKKSEGEDWLERLLEFAFDSGYIINVYTLYGEHVSTTSGYWRGIL